jgi:hypothetical protein
MIENHGRVWMNRSKIQPAQMHLVRAHVFRLIILL